MDNKHTPNHNQPQEDQGYENALRKLRNGRNISMEEIKAMLDQNPISDEEHIARLERLGKDFQVE
jgi:hypothetical protein